VLETLSKSVFTWQRTLDIFVIGYSANSQFTECFVLLNVTLGKQELCQVLDIKPAAKPWTLNKFGFPDSVTTSFVLFVL